MKTENKMINAIIFLTLIILGLIIRIAFAVNLGLQNGDVAVYGLMAKHILELKEFPVYVPLAHYSGIAASYTAAVLFKFFGISTVMLNLTAVLFSLSCMIVMLFIARELLDRAGVVAALILTVLPFHRIFIDYSLLLGNRSEDFFFMLLTLFIFIKWVKSGYSSRRTIPICLGFFLGVSLWTTPNAMPLFFTIVAVTAFYDSKNIFYKGTFILAGFIAGYIPAIIYNFQYPSAVFFRMAGRILNLDRSVLLVPSPATVIMRQMIWRISEISASAYKIPNLTAALIGIPSATLFIISIVLALKDHGFGRGAGKDAWHVLCVYVLWFVLLYATLVQIDTNRYMAPLCMISPLFIGYLLSHLKINFRFLSITLLSLLLIYNCYTIACAFPAKDSNHCSALASWLISKKLQYGFSDYSTAYMTQFTTKEKSIISPTLFYPTFCDRWPEDTKRVRSAREIFYVIDKQSFPLAASIIESTFKNLGISYKKGDVEGFEIYYDLSLLIYPESLHINEIYEKTKDKKAA